MPCIVNINNCKNSYIYNAYLFIVKPLENIQTRQPLSDLTRNLQTI